MQARKFYFVFNEKIKREIAKAAFNQNFIFEAPLVIVACADLEKISWYGERGKNLYCICDVVASMENLMILAQDFDLGTCWVGSFDEKKVSQILNLPENLKPIAIVPVGYPAKIPSPPERVKKEEAIEFIE